MEEVHWTGEGIMRRTNYWYYHFHRFFRAGNVSAHEAVCDDSDWLCRKRQKSSANKTNTVVRHEDVADGQLFLFGFGKIANVISKYYTTEKI